MSDNFLQIKNGGNLVPSAVPANPTNGDIYYDSTDNEFKFYENGAWTELGGGSGTGELTVLLDPNEVGTTWTGTGTITTETSSANLTLYPVITTGISIFLSGAQTGLANFNVPVGLRNRQLKIDWYQTAAVALNINVKSYTDAGHTTAMLEYPLSTDNSLGVTTLPLAAAHFVTYFNADSREFYQIEFVNTLSVAGVVIQNAIVGPGLQAQDTGEINVMINPYATNNTVGASVGTNHTVLRNNANSPLSPTVQTCYAITATANATESSTSGIGFSTTTMPVGLYNKKLKSEFYVTSAVGDTWALSIYDNAGTRVPLTTDNNSLVTTLPAGTTGKFTTYFDATQATSYTPRLTRIAGTGTTTAYLTSLITGPGIQPQGAVVGPVTVFTPTLTGFGTPTFATASYWRTGEVVNVQATFTAGTTTAVLGRFGLPVGTVSSSTGSNVIGRWYKGNATASTRKGGAIRASNGNAYVTFSLDDYTSAASPLSTGENASTAVATGEVVTLYFSLPIAEWAGSGTINLAQNDVDYAYNSSVTTTTDTTSFAIGPNGAAFAAFAPSGNNNIAKRVRFSTPVQATDIVGVYIIYPGSGGLVDPVSVGLGYSENDAGTTAYGMWLSPTVGSATDYDVHFQTKGSPSGSGWASFSAYKWVVVRHKPGQAVGFGLATATQSGLIGTGAQTFAGLKAFNGSISLPGGVPATLSYYNESTFSPAPAFNAGTSGGVTAPTIFSSSFTRIGRLVHFAFDIAFRRTDGTTGLTIGGLPIAAGVNTPVTIGYLDGVTIASGTLVYAQVTGGSQAITFFTKAASGAATAMATATNTTFANTGADMRVMVSGTYAV